MKNLIYTKNVSYILRRLVFAVAILTPSISNATTYYVAKTGDASNPGTEILPFPTIKQGVGSLSAGDILYVKKGEYKESILSWKTPIPHGTSWDNPVTIAAFPGHTVTMKPPSGHAAFWIQDPTVKYIVIDGFIIDGQDSAINGIKLSNNVTHVRIQNSEIKNAKESGILVTVCSGCTDPHLAPHDTYHEFINLHVHHNGSSMKDHGFYIATSHNLVEYCDVHHNSGNGGHFYSAYYPPGAPNSSAANYNTLRYSTLHENSQKSFYLEDPTNQPPSQGWILASGEGNEAYGNIFYDQPRGLTIGFGARNALAYNNIIYSNTEKGIHIYGSWGGSIGARVFNNTVYNNGQTGISVTDNAKDTIIYNNIAFKNGPAISGEIWLEPKKAPGTVQSNNLLADPKFIDGLANDYKLQEASPAIDVGLTIPEVTIDFFGIERAQGQAYDIGAIEQKQGEDITPPSTPLKVVVY